MASNMQTTLEYKLPCQILSTFGKKMYLEEKNSDIHFIFNSNDDQCIKIPAHKLLLTESSEVFSTMFNGSWKEKDEVKIVDASVEAFKEFLQFFYLDKLNITVENVAEVMYLANKYNVDECMAICSIFLKTTLVENDVCLCYKLAIIYEQPSLKKFCELFIKLRTQGVLASDNFLQCDFDVLDHMLMLGLDCSEYELFSACLRRMNSKGRTKAEKDAAKTELRKLLKHFRFGSMSFGELASLSSLCDDIFTFDEYKEIVQMIHSASFRPKLLNGLRLTRSVTFHSYTVKLKLHPHYIKNIEKTIFSTDQTIVLECIYCPPVIITNSANNLSTETKIPSILTIFEYSLSTEPKEKVTLHIQPTQLSGICKIGFLLWRPILIERGKKYEIQFEQSPPRECDTIAELKSEMLGRSDSVFKCHPFPVVNHYNSNGLVDSLLFRKI